MTDYLFQCIVDKGRTINYKITAENYDGALDMLFYMLQLQGHYLITYYFLG